MRYNNTRTSDSTFDLNLAPVLDIIVSIVPMLLLSVAFVQIKIIEVPTPQVVMEQKNVQVPKPETTITLRVSKKTGFSFDILEASGKLVTSNVNLLAGQFDFSGLMNTAIKLKETYPEISRLQLNPDGDVAFDDLVKVMDQVRQKQRVQAEAVSISEAAKAKPVENFYLFPDITFSSVGG